MGTYATVIAEKQLENGEWDSIDHKAVEVLECQNYFKFAFWHNVRNYYQLKPNLVPTVEIERKIQEHEDDELSAYAPWSNIQERELLLARYKISYEAAHQFDINTQRPSTAFLISDLLAFDYNQVVETREIKNVSEFLHFREVEEGKTYRDMLGEGYIQALETLSDLGAQRIIVIYD